LTGNTAFDASLLVKPIKWNIFDNRKAALEYAKQTQLELLGFTDVRQTQYS
jgi:hypothetical protein